MAIRFTAAALALAAFIAAPTPGDAAESRLSNPLANGGFWSIQLLPAAGRFAELDTDDVPASFFEMFGIIPPHPAVPLSDTGISLAIEFPPGEKLVTLTIPIAADGVAEPSEGVGLLLDGFGDPDIPQPIELTGMVSDSSSAGAARTGPFGDIRQREQVQAGEEE
jgi:hypothetical protein